MSLKLYPATVKAGPAVFSIANESLTEEHEMIVVRLKSVDQTIPMIRGKIASTKTSLIVWVRLKI